jgi:glycine cleavage system transcriptional repressor
MFESDRIWVRRRMIANEVRRTYRSHRFAAYFGQGDNRSMQKNFVLTVTGPDRIGIVERVTGLLFAHGGNVETSRMARLGGEFAILMLVSMPDDRVAGLDADLEALAADGYKLTTSATARAHAGAHPDWLPYRIEVEGADDEGIIHEVARYLSERGINIESVDSETTPAPVSGSPLFSMTAQVVAPPSLAGKGWEAGLQEIADRMNLEIRVLSPDD